MCSQDAQSVLTRHSERAYLETSSLASSAMVSVLCCSGLCRASILHCCSPLLSSSPSPTTGAAAGRGVPCLWCQVHGCWCFRSCWVVLCRPAAAHLHTKGELELTCGVLSRHAGFDKVSAWRRHAMPCYSMLLRPLCIERCLAVLVSCVVTGVHVWRHHTALHLLLRRPRCIA